MRMTCWRYQELTKAAEAHLERLLAAQKRATLCDQDAVADRKERIQRFAAQRETLVAAQVELAAVQEARANQTSDRWLFAASALQCVAVFAGIASLRARLVLDRQRIDRNTTPRSKIWRRAPRGAQRKRVRCATLPFRARSTSLELVEECDSMPEPWQNSQSPYHCV